MDHIFGARLKENFNEEVVEMENSQQRAAMHPAVARFPTDSSVGDCHIARKTNGD